MKCNSIKNQKNRCLFPEKNTTILLHTMENIDDLILEYSNVNDKTTGKRKMEYPQFSATLEMVSKKPK